MNAPDSFTPRQVNYGDEGNEEDAIKTPMSLKETERVPWAAEVIAATPAETETATVRM